MKVYVVYLIDSDNCSYSYEVLHKIYAKEHDAEVEKTRIELLFLMKEECVKNNFWSDNPHNLSEEDLNIATYAGVCVDEVEVL